MTEEVNYSVGQLLEAINNKADLDGSNLDNTSFETFINSLVDAKLGNIDYVIESKVATDEDPTWYRVYKSGWVEQGGQTDSITASSNANKSITITFNKPFIDTNYLVQMTYKNGGSGYAGSQCHANNLTTTSCTLNVWSNEGYSATTALFWYACGQSA